MKRSNNERS